jgi:RHS repeat-associated protein
LIAVTHTNVFKTTFLYDGWKRLRVKKEFDGSGVLTNETHYVYDGMLAIQERNSNNVPLVTYTRGLDLSGTLDRAGGIGGLLARTDHLPVTSNQMLASAFYHCDGNGNITALLSQNGLMLAWYLYDPFGRSLAQSGPLADANVIRFSSKAFVARIGCYYYGYRFYSPDWQRWLNKDPSEEEGGINLYGFLRNRALNEVDIMGLKVWIFGEYEIDAEWGESFGIIGWDSFSLSYPFEKKITLDFGFSRVTPIVIKQVSGQQPGEVDPPEGMCWVDSATIYEIVVDGPKGRGFTKDVGARAIWWERVEATVKWKRPADYINVTQNTNNTANK